MKIDERGFYMEAMKSWKGILGIKLGFGRVIFELGPAGRWANPMEACGSGIERK